MARDVEDVVQIEQNEIEKSDIEKSDSGSISPLILGYFVILMSIGFLILNVLAVYMARRDLLAATEAALYRASSELNEQSYYLNPARPLIATLRGQEARVPIDCQAASRTFAQELSGNDGGRSTRIMIEAFECNGEEISARTSRVEQLPFQLRVFNLTNFTNRVRAGVVSQYID